MANPTVTDVCRALATDAHSLSGLVRYRDCRVAEPHEAWLAADQMWVRADGGRASGWSGQHHYSVRFGFFDRWRIRRAFAAWLKRRSSPQKDNPNGG